MTQEDRQLLLVDLSARFPYGVILDVDTTDWKVPQGHMQVKIEGYGIIFKDMSLIVNGSYYGDNYKPYLRPMSSMTEEEKELCGGSIICYNEFEGNSTLFDTEGLDYLNKNMYDYRGLIPRGLAIEAPEGMYKEI